MNPSTIRILLVEDNAHDAELTRARLERTGIAVEFQLVDTEAGFVEALHSRSFDLVLSDFHLPTFSGPEALRITRAFDSDLPFIFVSGVLGEEHAVDMLKQGATDYVLKQRLERLPIVFSRAMAESQEKQSRRQAERRLHERETYFGQLIDALRDYAVIALSSTGTVESWNRASEWIFGYAAEETLGRPSDQFVRRGGGDAEPGQTLAQELENTAASGSTYEERWLLRKNGTSFYASVVTTPIFDDAGDVRGFSRIVRDTTDSRVAADLLEAAKDQAETANRAKDHFLAVLSHELRTPLGPIYAAAQALDMQGDLPAASRRSVELIKRNVEVEARLIDDLLDISKIVNDKLTLRLEPTDLGKLLSGMAELFGEEAIANHVNLRYTPPESQVVVQADAARLQQIIWNLLKNAIKFTPKGGEIGIRLVTTGHGKVHVEVSDTGIGIHQQALVRIFNAFDQGDDLGSHKRGGLGLGLAIASSLAQRHDGSLGVHSEGIGKGATFTLTLDHPAGMLPPDADQTPVDVSSNPGTSSRILLVEDNLDTAEAMLFLLTELGFDVQVAQDVSTAREWLATGQFDTLVSDMGLPDGDGIDVLKAFDKTDGRIAIALTGYGMDADVQRCLAAGFDEHLTKPLDIDRLTAILSRGR